MKTDIFLKFYKEVRVIRVNGLMGYWFRGFMECLYLFIALRMMQRPDRGMMEMAETPELAQGVSDSYSINGS